jgi:hypothetical protein
MVCNTDFNNISATLYIVVISFIGGGNQCTLRNHRPAASH